MNLVLIFSTANQERGINFIFLGGSGILGTEFSKHLLNQNAILKTAMKKTPIKTRHN